MPIIGFYSHFLVPLGLIYFGYLFINNLRFSRKINITSIWFVSLSFLIGIFIINSLDQLGNLSSLALITLLLTLAVFLSRSVLLQAQIINHLIIFILCLSLINTVLYLGLGDFSGRFNGNSIWASLLGLNIERPLFFFSNGVNHYGIILAFCIVLVLCWQRDFLSRSSNLASILLKSWMFIHFLIVLLIIDSRGALLGLIFAYFGSRFFGTSKSYHYLLIFIPVLIPALGILSLIFDLQSIIFLREGSSLFSHREFLWIAAVDGIRELSLSSLLFGSGASGYINYSFGEIILAYFTDRGSNVGSLHNGYLQLIFEFGVIGLILFLASYIWLVRRLHEIKSIFKISPLFNYFFMVSATEATLSLSYFFIIVSIVCYALLIINKEKRFASVI